MTAGDGGGGGGGAASGAPRAGVAAPVSVRRAIRALSAKASRQRSAGTTIDTQSACRFEPSNR